MDRKQNRQRALERQVQRLDRRLEALAHISSRYAWARLATFIAGIGISLALLAAVNAWVSGISATLWLVIFTVLAQFHTRIKDSINRHTIWRGITQTHLARMALDWDHIPQPLISTPRAGFPLELDLDLTGPRALHRLIDTCVSREGSLRLRDWLVSPEPDPAHIARRQAIVRELVPLIAFRDKLRLNAVLAAKGTFRRWDGQRVLDWLANLPVTDSLRGWRIGLTVLAVSNLILLALSALAGIPALWRITTVLYAVLYLWRVQLLGDLFKSAFALSDPLTDLRAVFEYLETYRYGPNHELRALCAPFLDGEHRPSQQLRRVTRVLAAASVRHNPYFWMIISIVMPWDLYVAHWLNQSKAAVARQLPRWVDVWFEVEALNALAGLAYLNPAYTFPTLLPAGAQPVFQARAMGHPLLPDEARVCNDFTLAEPGDLAMITGSNMSGKSTFLRTLGINLCLTYAGGPVMAQDLQTVPFRLFTCIRVTDSVTDGISYFYAEVKRLKALLDALQADDPLPLCFLIDEIFRGTNNRERLIGSRSYIRALVGHNGTGALSTHDLELVRLADEIPQITNYHFEEAIDEGRMIFDYTLRPGPSPTTNALKIMEMEGLPVTQPAEELPPQ